MKERSPIGVWLKAGILSSQVADNLGRSPDSEEAGARWKWMLKWSVNSGGKWILGTSYRCKGNNPATEREHVKDQEQGLYSPPWETLNLSFLQLVGLDLKIWARWGVQTCDVVEGIWVWKWGNRRLPWNDFSMWMYSPPLLFSSLFLVQCTRICLAPENPNSFPWKHKNLPDKLYGFSIL